MADEKNVFPAAADDGVPVREAERNGKWRRGEYYFTVFREADGVHCLFHGERSRQPVPDFRLFSGAVREALRAAAEHRAAREEERAFQRFNKDMECSVVHPDAPFIEAAAEAGILRDLRGRTLVRGSGTCGCGLLIEDLASGRVAVSLVLRDEEGAVIARGGRPEYGKPAAPDAPEAAPAFYTLSRTLAARGNEVYRIADIGPRWVGSDRVCAQVPKSDAPALLSLLCSTFTNMPLIYAGWTVKTGGALTTVPALFFMKIDKWGHLHVRPLHYLRGFPPLFLENEAVMTAVSFDEARKTLRVADVVYAESPGALLRGILSRASRATGVKKGFYEEKGRVVMAPSFAGGFLEKHIIELSRTFALLQTRSLAGSGFSFAKPRLRVSLGRGIDYLSGSAVVELEGEGFSFGRFMEEYRKQGWVTLSDGRRAFPDTEVMAKLDRLVSQVKGDEVELSSYDMPALLGGDTVVLEGDAWKSSGSLYRFYAFYTGYHTISLRAGAFSLARGTLRPYQEYGARWLDYLRAYGMGGCLADEMGLGKTVQVITLLRALSAAGAKGTCLVVCPKTLVFNWQAELARFAPELPCALYYGPGRDKTLLAVPPP
ncbi:MAG: hypothetical protein LBD24_03730, partial [Spirochaetaceae bacterium]|nr:hypothetical protein [Spirochaetaceae bacterium]